MGEIGSVTEIIDGGKYAEVSFTRSEACAKCGVCRESLHNQTMSARALNPRGAVLGDSVEMELRDGAFIRSAVLMYGLPALSFIVGVLAPLRIFGALGAGGGVSEISSALIGSLLVFITYTVIRKNVHKLKKDGYTPVIVRVLEGGREPGNYM